MQHMICYILYLWRWATKNNTTVKLGQWASKTAKANFKFENDSTASIDLVHACKQLSLMTAEVILIDSEPTERSPISPKIDIIYFQTQFVIMERILKSTKTDLESKIKKAKNHKLKNLIQTELNILNKFQNCFPNDFWNKRRPFDSQNITYFRIWNPDSPRLRLEGLIFLALFHRLFRIKQYRNPSPNDLKGVKCTVSHFSTKTSSWYSKRETTWRKIWSSKIFSFQFYYYVLFQILVFFWFWG